MTTLDPRVSSSLPSLLPDIGKKSVTQTAMSSPNARVGKSLNAKQPTPKEGSSINMRNRNTIMV